MRVLRNLAASSRRSAAPRHKLAFVLSTLLLLTTISCHSTSKVIGVTKSAPSPSATTATATTDPASSVRSAVETAYNAMWMDMAAAAKTANYQDPVLASHASGAALSTLVRGLYSYQQRGLVIMGTLSTRPNVTALSPPTDPTKANLVDCIDDAHWLVYKKTGGLEDNVPGGHRKVTATLEERSGAWKVTVLDSGAEGSC